MKFLIFNLMFISFFTPTSYANFSQPNYYINGYNAVITGEYVGIKTFSPEVELDVGDGVINAAAICDENNLNCIDLSNVSSVQTLQKENIELKKAVMLQEERLNKIEKLLQKEF